MALEDMAATPPLDEGGDVDAEVAALVEKYGQEAVQGAVEAAGGPPGAEALEGGDPLAEAMGEEGAPDMGPPDRGPMGVGGLAEEAAAKAFKGKDKDKAEDEGPPEGLIA
jgi:hypothetical protein